MAGLHYQWLHWEVPGDSDKTLEKRGDGNPRAPDRAQSRPRVGWGRLRAGALAPLGPELALDCRWFVGKTGATCLLGGVFPREDAEDPRLFPGIVLVAGTEVASYEGR